MAVVEIDGIRTRYEVVGDGPPVLMFSPAGFDSSLDDWATFGRYRHLEMVDGLSQQHTCVLFDRRETGQSGGRLERLTWDAYVDQAVGLIDHLGLERVGVIGGGVGCSTAVLLTAAHPERVAGLALFSPAGGDVYRATQHRRFTAHVAYALENGVPAVVELARSTDVGFTKDARVGPWASVLRRDVAFADAYAETDLHEYVSAVGGSARQLFDHDEVPGPTTDDLERVDAPTLVVPGEGDLHPAAAARHLQEHLPRAEYWDIPVAELTSASTAAHLRGFFARV